MAAQKAPRGVEKKRKSKKRKSRTEVSSSESSSESEVEQKKSRKTPSSEPESVEATPEPTPKPAKKEKNKKAKSKATTTTTDGDAPMADVSPSPSPSPVQKPAAPAKTLVAPGKLAEEFDAIYIRKITTELADDLDKVRSAQDFKANSIPMLIHALKQGESLFTTDEKRRVIATAKA